MTPERWQQVKQIFNSAIEYGPKSATRFFPRPVPVMIPCAAKSSRPASTFTFPPSGTVATLTRWSTDGKAILYSVNSNNVSNICSQPIDGGPAKQITDFKDSLITGFAWSRDGKQLACARGALMRDAVLVTDVK